MFTQKTHLSLTVGLLLVGLLLALSPAIALAQGFAQAVLYEVLESPPARPSTGGAVGAFVPDPVDGTLTRLAQATEAGPVVFGTGSLVSWQNSGVVIHAQSRVDLTTGSGPVSGSFTVDTAGGTISGKLSGTLDLSPVLSNTAPLAPTWGTWGTLGKRSSRLGGTFQGVAQIPVDCGLLGGPAGYFCYLKPDLSGADLLQPNEFKDGVPLVRFLIGFTAAP